ncbi:hypothetical protein ACFFX1_36670 [Dactylosporangium sucinum]|uniref:Lipoprotein n=1 Tax=Dactylosporangium sucinum TaxID=1424081 RepID=A0A917TTR1_9ACTN|nr:hypothetical protein [Dactylosporangium sucinum]GGM37189.1 hypothetical protein GCM10007977_043260 [Dactylosporangium sucinum]
MQLRRILLALAVSTTLGLATGCAQDSGDASQGAAPAASSAAPSPTVDLKADTEAVCKAVVAAYEAEKMEFLNALAEMLTASLDGDQAALDKARSKGQAIVDRITKAVNPEIAKAADPKAKAALEQFVATVAKMMTAESLEDPEFEAALDKAIADAGVYCPALKE